jgi:Xaa-Pro dipeptidase
MLLNHGRAMEVMARRGLDGLAAQLPINVYYLSDYWGQLAAANFDWSYFVVLPKSTAAPAALVLPGLDLRNLISSHTWIPNIVTYTARAPAGASATAGGGIPYGGWPTQHGAKLSPLAQEWVDGVAKWTASTSATPIDALVRAIREAGLSKGVIGVDDERLVTALPEAGLSGAKIVYAREAFNEIRIVKTEDEIELLRKAAKINEAAVLEALAALRIGATWEEIVETYMIAMARSGGAGVYLACGAGGLPHRKVMKSEPMMFDGLGKYRGYHGDFGRTAVVGDPTPETIARVKALQVGWSTAFEIMRPGLTYSELTERVGHAIKAAGFPGAFRDPAPHSLGLEHTDDPRPRDLAPGLKPDRVLEENMVINVDLPHIEIGWGAVHLEDTVRVTKTGCEALTSMQTDLRVLSA